MSQLHPTTPIHEVTYYFHSSCTPNGLILSCPVCFTTFVNFPLFTGIEQCCKKNIGLESFVFVFLLNWWLLHIALSLLSADLAKPTLLQISFFPLKVCFIHPFHISVTSFWGGRECTTPLQRYLQGQSYTV